MIKVNIKKNHILIKGHAMFDDYGKDIVCASASTMVITTVNAILSIEKDAIEYKQADGMIEIFVLKNSPTVDALINNMINLLKELENKYKKNIQIEEVR